MKKSEYKILQQAFKILKKRFYYPKGDCKSNTFGCWQCRCKIWMKEFEYVLEDIKEMDELK